MTCDMHPLGAIVILAALLWVEWKLFMRLAPKPYEEPEWRRQLTADWWRYLHDERDVV